MAEDLIVAPTKRIAPRYYGLKFKANESSTGIFDNPSTAALAYIAITSPSREGGLRDMLGTWQKHKILELDGKFGYQPIFYLGEKEREKLLECTQDRLVEIVRGKIRANHGSYNLFDCHGNESVANLVLKGEVLSAKVRSQKAGWHEIHLKGAFQSQTGIRYADSRCDNCRDSSWMEEKGGRHVSMRRNCIHIKAAETESYLERRTMRTIRPFDGEKSMTFNFLQDNTLKHLIVDILISHEVLGNTLYSIDRKLLLPIQEKDGKLSPSLIPQSIMPLMLLNDISSGKATFEILNQKRNVTRKIRRDILSAQHTIFDAFERELYLAGYKWKGYGLELGQPTTFYANNRFQVGLAVYEKYFGDRKDIANGLPFYTVRSLEDTRNSNPLAIDGGPQHPFAQNPAKQWRLDDRIRKNTLNYTRPAVDIVLPEANTRRVLRYQIPSSVVSLYQRSIREHQKFPEGILREFHLK